MSAFATGADGAADGDRALRYWRAASALAACHLLGVRWPPAPACTFEPRSRLVGHWGCNPGIAWAVGHLASVGTAFDLVVGTGHASAFLFAHRAIAAAWSAEPVNRGIRRYGQHAGSPTEYLDTAGVPYLGGELGPALAMSTGLAQTTGHVTACIVGDGELETPVALASIVHQQSVRAAAPAPTRWLPVINANGARMGSPSLLDPRRIRALAEASGLRVLHSGDDHAGAAAAATEALAAAALGEPVLWISETPKGFGAPPSLGGLPFVGYRSHKLPHGFDRGAAEDDVRSWLATYEVGDLVDETGAIAADVVALAGRARLALSDAPTGGRAPQPRTSVSTEKASCARARGGEAGAWVSPMAAVDAVLADAGVRVFSPDEAASNRLDRVLERGRVTEVLAEEASVAWAWGVCEGGDPCVVVTYEAFAPLMSTVLAQYAKLLCARPRRGAGPLVVILTSLGWANAPTHQNTDLVGTVLARPHGALRLHTPVSASAAAAAVETALQSSDSIHVVVCSKQPLLDVPFAADGTEVELLFGAHPEADIVAVGDIAFTEAAAAAAFALREGVSTRVVGMNELSHSPAGAAVDGSGRFGLAQPTVGLTAAAPAHVESCLWRRSGVVFPVLGYSERSGATPWETLRANEMDRTAVVRALAGVGVRVAPGVTHAWAAELDAANATGRHPGTLPVSLDSVLFGSCHA